jgi:hypothetical protein
METRLSGVENDQDWYDLFIAVEGESHAVRRGWPVADSILWFWLERGVDGTKHCQKTKQRQRACLSSMGRKCDMARRAWRRRLEERRHRGEEGEEMMLIGLMWILLDKKWRKYTQLIQLLHMDGEDLKEQWVIFLKNICKWDLVLFISSRITQCWKQNFK